MRNVIIIVLLIILGYLLALDGRRGHKGLEKLKKFHYAHRGLHGNGVPENSMQAFEKAKQNGYGIELDVHLLKDGTLAVFHDNTLDRVTGISGKVEDLTKGDLKNIHLEGTDETIPELCEVLTLYDGAAPLVIELKPVGGNHAELAKAVCDALDGYDGDYCIESFDPRCLYWLKNNRPEILRGQLSQNFFKANDKLALPLKIVMTTLVTNFLTKPDFVAFNFKHKNGLPVKICEKLWGLAMVGWTIRDKNTHDKAINDGWLSIFEYFKP